MTALVIERERKASSCKAPKPELEGEVRKALKQVPYQSDHLKFVIESGDVTINGEVRSYYHVQLIIHALRNVKGVGRVVNNCRVTW